MEIPTQPVIEPKSAGVRARTWLIVLSVITVLTCGAVAAALILASNARRDAERRDKAISKALDQLRGQVDVLTSTVNKQQSEMSELVNEVGTGGASTEDLQTQVADQSSRIANLVDCINTYMDTVAHSNGGYYRYYYC
jgi:peptidoglycan hydrolase CwlO-like protein